MSLAGVLLGLINVCIVVAILFLVGYVVVWLLGILGMGVPDVVQKLWVVIVALIALYMVVSLLVGGVVPWRIVGAAQLAA